MSQVCCLSIRLRGVFPIGWSDLASHQYPTFNLFWLQISPIWRSCVVWQGPLYTFQLRADKFEPVESKLKMSALSKSVIWHLLKQGKKCSVGDFRNKPLVDRIFTSDCFSENWDSSNRPELFPPLSSSQVGETAQTRLHYTHSAMDIPTVFQGNYKLINNANYYKSYCFLNWFNMFLLCSSDLVANWR